MAAFFFFAAFFFARPTPICPNRPGVVQCALCVGGSTPPGSCATPAVRLSAKLLWRRCSGSLGQEHASKVDGLVHHDDMFAEECGRDQEKDCAQARAKYVGRKARLELGA